MAKKKEFPALTEEKKKNSNVIETSLVTAHLDYDDVEGLMVPNLRLLFSSEKLGVFGKIKMRPQKDSAKKLYGCMFVGLTEYYQKTKQLTKSEAMQMAKETILAVYTALDTSTKNDYPPFIMYLYKNDKSIPKKSSKS